MDAATVINAATRTPGMSSGHLLMMVGRQLMLGGFGSQGRWSQDGQIGTPTELMEDMIILTRRNELMEELLLRMIGLEIALMQLMVLLGLDIALPVQLGPVQLGPVQTYRLVDEFMICLLYTSPSPRD